MDLKERTIIENVPIVDVTQDGTGIAKLEGLVYFIPRAIAGDVVKIEVFKKKRSHVDARLVEIETPSPDRVTPHCEHFGTCGGCSLQHISYSAQLKFKQK